MARPITYDRDEVIDDAVQKFWASGFEGCDVETLMQSSGLNRHSLYKAFGGKTGLFIDALSRYVDQTAASYLALLDGAAGLEGIVAYFKVATGAICEAGHGGVKGYDGRGCLITNTVIELGRSDERVSEIIERYYSRIQRAFADLIVRGQRNGTIRADIDADGTARWLRLTSQGMSVSARIGVVSPDLADIVRAALKPPLGEYLQAH